MPATKTRRDKLNIGIMLHSLTVSAWVYKILSDIEAADFLNLSLFIVNCEKRPHGNPFQRLRRVFPTILFSLYEQLDYALYKEPVDAFAPVDISDRFNRREILEVVPIRKRLVQTFSLEDLAAI